MLGALSLSAALALAGAGAATAEESDYLLISTDGQSFSRNAATPIFSGMGQLVPGGATPGTLWVRNAGVEPAYLSLGGMVDQGDRQLAGYVELAAQPAGGETARAVLGMPGTCSDIAQGWEMMPGTTLELDLQLGMVMAAPNETMNRTMSFSVLLLLDSAGPRPACPALASPDPEAGQSPVPGTERQPGRGSDGSDEGRSDAVALVGLGTAGSNGGTAAGGGQTVPAGGIRHPKGTENNEQLTPAAFWESTVEPVIRTVPGTLLIVMAAALSAAAIYRLRVSRRHEQASAE